VRADRPFIFDTGLAPSSAAAALTALRLVDHRLVTQLRRNAQALAAALGVPPPAGAVVPVRVGDPVRAAAARDACRDEGVLVGCFRPPSVPDGQSCLRLTARADLTGADFVRAADVVHRALAA
jgi:8-amino-7-oxononanoate synthase